MGVTLVKEYARFVAPDAIEAGGRRYTAERFLISTGASQGIPSVDGLAEAGYLTFKDAIDLPGVPESIFVMGGGAVGCEFPHLFSTFGARVTITDRNDALIHGEDHEVGGLIARLFEERGVEVLLETQVRRVDREGNRRRVTYERKGVRDSVLVDEVLIATGKAPNVHLGLEAAGIDYDERKGVTVDASPAYFERARLRRRRRHGAVPLHARGRLPGDAGLRRHVRPPSQHRLPGNAALRLHFPRGRDRGSHRDGGACEEPRRTNRPRRDRRDGPRSDVGQMDGFVKVIADAQGKLLGGAIVCARAGEVVHELALAIQLGATAEQVASTIHAFPTYSEALAAACAEVQL